MRNEIHDILVDSGPGLTSDLIVKLVNTGISSVAARKRVQRASTSYNRLAGLRFEKNARFIYLPEQFGTQLYWENLEGAFYKSGKSYWCTIVGLKARGGIVSLNNFPMVTGAPHARKGQLSPEIILERLKAVNLLEEFEEGDHQYVGFRAYYYPRDELSQIIANEIAESIAIEGIKNWARRIGFGSYGKFAIRGDKSAPSVSGISWDMSAPSYMRPLVSVRNSIARPGFLVCDVSLRNVIEKDEAEAFVRKCDHAAAPMKVPPIMPMMVGHVFSSDALQLLKGKGILAITIRNLFGEELAQSLRDLVTMLTDLGAKISADPDQLVKVVTSLTKIEGASDNLRGSLFELIVGCLVKDIEGGYLKTGQRLQDSVSGRKAEIDVQLDRGAKEGVLVVECKAKNPNARVSEVEIKKWYEDRVPLIYSILSGGGTYTKKPLHFELWTNGEFSNSGLTWLKNQKLDFGTHFIGWKDGKELKNYANKAKNASLRSMLNEHYFRSPLKNAI